MSGRGEREVVVSVKGGWMPRGQWVLQRGGECMWVRALEQPGLWSRREHVADAGSCGEDMPAL